MHTLWVVKVQLLQTPTVKSYDLTFGCFFFLFFFLLQAIPFGKIPILEVDGVTIHQSLAIARYLARESGNTYLTTVLLCSAPTFNAQKKYTHGKNRNKHTPRQAQPSRSQHRCGNPGISALPRHEELIVSASHCICSLSTSTKCWPQKHSVPYRMLLEMPTQRATV